MSAVANAVGQLLVPVALVAVAAPFVVAARWVAGRLWGPK